MKTFKPDNEYIDDLSTSNGVEEVTDLLIDNKRGHSLIKCNPDLAQSYNVLKSTPMGHKGRFYQRVLSKNNVMQDSRSQSLPMSLDNKNKLEGDTEFADCCDIKSKLLPECESPPLSPTQDLWFKTWPERCEKIKTNDSCVSTETNPEQTKNSISKTCDINVAHINTANKVTLNEALKNISLAYSPVTKQLHLVKSEEVTRECNGSLENDKIGTCNVDNNEIKQLGHKRNEAGSFSSTVSSLSDPSPSGSLLETEDTTNTAISEFDTKPRKKKLSSFFNRSVFSWKSVPLAPTNNSTVWKLFGKSCSNNFVQSSPQHSIVSSSALIQHMRPSNLPAKNLDEDHRHKEEYKAIVAAAKKKEMECNMARQKQQKLQLQLEEQQAIATKHFLSNVLPNWESHHNTRKTRDLWWQGLPSSVRGKVWRLAIGNELNLTQQLYEICLSRAQNRLSSPEPSYFESDIDQESSMDVIQLDIARTFPNLCIFQEGGPYFEILHSLLAAYVCYRPDVGYVQGMSFIAAILILNMDQFDAFVCFANLLNRPLHMAAFTLNQEQMQAYYSAYNEVFNYNLPKLYSHFSKSGLTPDLYLLDWIYTLFAKAMPLDVACRIWDNFLRDGEEFLFRTALGILHLNQDYLMDMDFLHGAQYLTRLPDDLSSDHLFKSIQTVTTGTGKQTFNQIVDRYSLSVSDS